MLSKSIGYTFVIKLPSEKLMFTGLKDVFKFPMDSKIPKGYGVPKPETVIYGPSMSGHYGPPHPAPMEPAPTYGTPDSGWESGEHHGGGHQGGGSSYGSLKKDLDGGSGSFSNHGYEETFPGKDMQHLSHNFNVFTDRELPMGNQSRFGEGHDILSGSSELHYSVNDLPSKRLDVIMSPLDHQRLLGFLSIEKTFDGYVLKLWK